MIKKLNLGCGKLLSFIQILIFENVFKGIVSMV